MRDGDLAAGQPVRLTIRAADVLIAVGAPELSGLSARNVVEAVIEEMRDRPDRGVLLRLRAAQAELLALVTRDSVEALGLRPGLSVRAVFKSAAPESPLMGD
jgi:molybdate transport system ATP-binding protein